MLKPLIDSILETRAPLPNEKVGEIWELGRDATDEPIDVYLGKVPLSEIGLWQRVGRALLWEHLGYKEEPDPRQSGVNRRKLQVYTQGLVDQSPLAIKKWRDKHEVRKSCQDRIVLSQALHPLFNGPDSLDPHVYASREQLKSYIGQDPAIKVVYLEELPEHRSMFDFLNAHRSLEDGTFMVPEDLALPDFNNLNPDEYSCAFLKALLLAEQKQGDFANAVKKTAPVSAVSQANYTLVEMAFRLSDHLLRKNIQGGASRQKKYNELLTDILTGTYAAEMPELSAFLEAQNPAPTRYLRIDPYDTYADAIRQRSHARSRWSVRVGIPVLATLAGFGWNHHKAQEAEAERMAQLEAATQERAINSFRGYNNLITRFDQFRVMKGTQNEEALYFVADLVKLAYQRYPDISFVSEAELKQELLSFLEILDPELKRQVIGQVKVDARLMADFVDSWYSTRFLTYAARNSSLGVTPQKPYAHITAHLEDPSVVVDATRFDSYSAEEVRILGEMQAEDPEGWCYEIALAPSYWEEITSAPSVGTTRSFDRSQWLVVARPCDVMDEGTYQEPFFGAMGAQAMDELSNNLKRWELLTYLPYLKEYCRNGSESVEFGSEPINFEHSPHQILPPYDEGAEVKYEARAVSVYLPERYSRSTVLLLASPGEDDFSMRRSADIVRSEGWCQFEDSNYRSMDLKQISLGYEREEWQKSHPFEKQSPTSEPN